MDKLSKEAVVALLASNAQPAATIYVPMIAIAAPPHISENQIRLKNLIHKASAQLGNHRTEHQLAKKLISQVDAVYNDHDFWEHQTPGLLICANDDNLWMFQLPIDTEEYVAIDEQFHLAPILGLIADAHDFYVITIAQQNPHLYRGNLYGLEPAGITLPTSVTEALNIDEANQKSENQGTATGPSSGGAASNSSSGRGWFNGRGGARSPQEADRMRFFRIIDSVMMDKIDRSLPLILGGTESEIAEYRSISKYPKILKGTIHGNHSESNADALFKQAHEIIQREIVEPDHLAVVEEYSRLSGANPERVAHDEKAITTAAEQGRIDKLLAPVYRSTSDTVRDSMKDVLRITFPEPSASKKLNNLALSVWRMSGRIVNVLPEQIPNNAPMAARLRY